MRILLLLDSFEENLPGKMLHLLCQRWAPIRELRLVAISLKGDGPLRERLRSLGVRTGLVENTGPLAVRREGRKELFSKLRPDLVHSHCAWPAMNARLYHGGNPWVPFVETVHDLNPSKGGTVDQLVRIGLERHTRKHVTTITASSLHVLKHLEASGVPRDRIRHIPMGVDGVQCFPLSPQSRERYRKLFGMKDDAPLVVTAGDLEPGHAELLKFWPPVLEKFPTARLYIIGDGPIADRIDGELKSNNPGESIRRIGSLVEIGPKIFGAADVVIHPGGEKSLPYEIAQAGASGGVVVAFKHGAIPEVIQDGVTGLLVEPKNHGQLGEAIIRLLADRHLRETIGHDARENVLENLEVSTTARMYIDIWRDLAPDALWDQTNNLTAGEVDPFPLEVSHLHDDESSPRPDG